MQIGSRYNQHSFAQYPAVNTARSSFNRSFNVKDTFNFDYLVPIYCDEIIPGDTCNLSVNAFARLATQKVPTMDNMYLDFFFFFVPCRLVWDNWERMHGAQDDPGDSTDYTVPQLELEGGYIETDTIYDHFGLPLTSLDMTVNAMPFRAYNLIWNEWFRSQELQDSVTVLKDDGPDDGLDYTLLKRGKRHDYFTSCLVAPQRGPAVEIPIGSIESNGLSPRFTTATTSPTTQRRLYSDNPGGTNNIIRAEGTLANTADYLLFGNETGLEVNQENVGTIAALREAFQIQSLLELDARGGTRFTELLLAHWNVLSPDMRLQRPEYLGGGSTMINSHPVPQTAPTSGTNAQAQLASFATAATNGGRIGFTKSFQEHGYVIGLVCARADLTYQQGLRRMWSKTTRFDFFYPKLQEIGDQAVNNDELRCISNITPGEVFGYQERYAEYKFSISEIKGQFRSEYAQSLDMWHLAQEFVGPLSGSQLTEEFIQQSTPIERIIAVTDAPHLLFDCWFQLNHTRPMMTYSTPASLGRF